MNRTLMTEIGLVIGPIAAALAGWGGTWAIGDPEPWPVAFAWLIWPGTAASLIMLAGTIYMHWLDRQPSCVATEVPMGGYETDIVAWSERQGALLQQRAAGHVVNEANLDWPNIAEEIKSVGHEHLFAVRSLLVQALLQILKAQAWPSSREVPHWRAEARGFRDDAAARFAPSMRQRIDIDRLYRRALRRMPDTIDDQPPLPVPAVCPMTLDGLLSDSAQD